MKRRVFSFQECARAKNTASILGRTDYKPIIAIDNAYPEHLEDDGPSRFFQQIISEKPFRIKQFKNVLGWKDLKQNTNATKLDYIGDILAEAIEARPELERKQNYDHVDWEIWFAPIWHSVLVDLAILLAECAIEDFEYLNPQWKPPIARDEPQQYLDYPAIVFDVAATAPDDPLLIALSKEYQIAAKSDLIDGSWINIFYRMIDELGFDSDEFISGDYSPDSVNRWTNPSNNRPHFYPFGAAQNFLLNVFRKKKFQEIMDAYDKDTLISLGDCLRQDTLPNWSGFPDLPKK